MSDSNTIRVLEMFAGVGGFRRGLEQANPDLFDVVWGNQWEPSRKAQDAFECYSRNFDTGIHSNEDISKVTRRRFPRSSSKLGRWRFPMPGLFRRSHFIG